MKSWKQSFWLAKFELQSSLKGSFFSFLFLIVLLLFFSTSISVYLTNNYVGFDLLFITAFTFATSWTKPKRFQVQKLPNHIWASPTLMMLQQLPINKNTISNTRFIIYFIYSFPFHLLLLISIYAFSSNLQEIMTPITFIAFSITWISFGIYVGFSIPASEAGERITIKKLVIYSCLFFVTLLIFLTIVNLISGHGLVYWTIIITKNWPVLSSVISILLAIIGMKYWRHYMKKAMTLNDYL